MALVKTNSEVPQEPTHDHFTDPALAEGRVVEDEIISFIARNWQQIALGILACLIGYYVYENYQNTQVAKMRSAADTFEAAQREYGTFESVSRQLNDRRTAAGAQPDDAAKKELDELEKKSNDARFKLEENVKLLLDQPFPYNRLGSIYSALAAHANGDLTTARAKLADFQPFDKHDVDSPERFYSETATLLLARMLIEDDATIAEGRELLKGLGSRGFHVSVSAAITLARIAASEDERKVALDVLNLIRTSRPEQAALVQSEIDRLSVSPQSAGSGESKSAPQNN